MPINLEITSIYVIYNCLLHNTLYSISKEDNLGILPKLRFVLKLDSQKCPIYEQFEFTTADIYLERHFPIAEKSRFLSHSSLNTLEPNATADAP